MSALLILWGRELPAASGLLAYAQALDPDAAPDVLILGGEGPFPLPSNIGQAFCLPVPDPERCLDPWQCCAGAAEVAAGYDLVLFADGPLAENLAHSLACALDRPCLTGVTELTADGPDMFLAETGACALELNAMCTLPLPAVAAAVPRPGEGETALRDATMLPGAEVALDVPVFVPAGDSVALAGAETVLVAGRGIGGAENWNKLNELVRRLGGCAAATRPVVLEGVAPMSALVGASAAVLSPKRCVVFGASGSAAFLVGVEGSGVLAGVNTDPDAALFRHCDCGAAEDCGAMLDALLALTSEGGAV